MHVLTATAKKCLVLLDRPAVAAIGMLPQHSPHQHEVAAVFKDMSAWGVASIGVHAIITVRGGGQSPRRRYSSLYDQRVSSARLP